jgi:hypothetical protein
MTRQTETEAERYDVIYPPYEKSGGRHRKLKICALASAGLAVLTLVIVLPIYFCLLKKDDGAVGSVETGDPPEDSTGIMALRAAEVAEIQSNAKVLNVVQESLLNAAANIRQQAKNLDAMPNGKLIAEPRATFGNAVPWWLHTLNEKREQVQARILALDAAIIDLTSGPGRDSAKDSWNCTVLVQEAEKLIDDITEDAQRLEKAAMPIVIALSADQAAQLRTLVTRVSKDMNDIQTATDRFKASRKSLQLKALIQQAEGRLDNGEVALQHPVAEAEHAQKLHFLSKLLRETRQVADDLAPYSEEQQSYAEIEWTFGNFVAAKNDLLVKSEALLRPAIDFDERTCDRAIADLTSILASPAQPSRRPQ